MAVPWLKTNNSQGLFLKDRHSIYSIQILSPNHIGIINMWVKNCIIDSFQCVNIDKIPDLKKKSIYSIQFYCNIGNMMFPFQIFINFIAKIFKRICGIESFSAKFNLSFTVYLLSLVLKKLPTPFSAHLERSYLHLSSYWSYFQLIFSYQNLHIY